MTVLRDKTLLEALGPRDGGRREGLVSEMIGAVSRAMSDDAEAQLRARQVDAIKRLSPSIMIVQAVNVAAFCVVLQLSGQLGPLALLWSGALGLFALHGLFRAYQIRNKPAPRTTSQRTVNRVVRAALLSGLLWAVPCLTFMPGLMGFPSLFGYLILTGMITGGAFVLYPIPAAAIAYVLPITLSGIASLWLVYGTYALGPAMVAAMFFLMFHRVIRRHADLFVSEFTNRIELEKRGRLIEDLLEDARLEAVGTRQVIEDRLARAQRIEAVGQLTAGIAHNFNNLLTAIQGNAELINHEGRTDPTLVEPILSACRQGAEQVQRLLSVAGKQMLRPEPVALGPLIERMVRMGVPALGPKYRIIPDLPDDLPPVLADPTQLENALLNLLLNARDAMPEGGSITIACRQMGHPALGTRLARIVQGGMVEISLRDTGRGMDARTLKRATDPFFTTKTEGLGTGLGLSSVAGFARQSGGDIAIESAPSKGTTVRIRLPVAQRTARDHPSEEDTAIADTRTVLLVEDLTDIREVAATMLRSLGYEVETASGPEEAIARIAAQSPIDIVLTDILLSSTITGIELATELRRLRPGLPVAFMSGWSQEHRGTDQGALRVLSKPFTRRELDAHLRAALAASPDKPALASF